MAAVGAMAALVPACSGALLNPFPAKQLRLRGVEGASVGVSIGRSGSGRGRGLVVWAQVDTQAEAETVPKKKSRPGESKGFVEEMRICAMKLHTRDQSKEGEKVAESKPLAKWEPTVKGYLQYLVDSKAVYDAMEAIVAEASHPMYAEFRNTGLERSARLAADIAWFAARGEAVPPPDRPGAEYAALLQDLAQRDPPAFLCHFYNVYFAHSAGGRMIGRKVAEMILEGKELEFYKWDGDLPELLAAVKAKLNRVAENWTREEKDHCLEETEKSFKFSGGLLRLLAS